MRFILFFLFVPTFVLAQSSRTYKNLVMEGAGVRGLAYAGALSVLEEKGIISGIENVCGSSSGTIAGLLVSVGYSSSEIRELVEKLPVQQFNDGSWGIPGKYFRFKKRYGIYKGEKFEAWLRERVKEKTGDGELTFAGLHALHLKDAKYKDLYCTGTNISKQQLEIFSYKTTPNMPVALAARISCGVPLYFEAIKLDNAGNRLSAKDTSSYPNYYVDGGLISNYPISLFDTCTNGENNPLECSELWFNPATIGIKLERQQQTDSLKNGSNTIPPYRIKNMNDYVGAFANLMMETLARKYPKLKNENDRTIYISQGNISPRVKKTKQQDKLLLYNNGVEATKLFLDLHDQ